MTAEEWGKAVPRIRYNADYISHAPTGAFFATFHNFPKNSTQAIITKLENAAAYTTSFYFKFIHVSKRIRGECQNISNAFQSEAKVQYNLPQS